MESRFLSRLEEDITAASDRFSRRCLLAERAAYLARLGDLLAARRDLDSVQRDNLSEPNLRVSVLANIADGLCHYYDNMSPEANDRYHRARALAIASKQYDLQAKAESHIALIEYGAHRFEQQFTSLDAAAERVAATDTQTLCRICMITGQTLHLANRFDLASDWYQQAKYYANEASDDAAMSAILHNMSSIWTVNWRNSQIGGIDTKDKSQTAWIGAASTSNFDQIVGTSVLGALTPLMKAQLRSLEHEYAEALAIYAEFLPGLTLKALGGWQVWLLADMAWCNLKLGNVEEASVDFEKCAVAINDSHHLDDRGAIFSRLSDGMILLEEFDLADSYKLEASKAWEGFAELQNHMHSLATAFSERRNTLLTRRLN